MEGRKNETGHKAACTGAAKSKKQVMQRQSVEEMNCKTKQRQASEKATV